jgi:hypothetical protein
VRQLRENIQCKCPVKLCNNSWALHHHNTPANMWLLLQQLLTSTKTTELWLALHMYFIFLP